MDNDLILILCMVGFLFSLFLIAVLRDLLTWLFPCAASWLHHVTMDGKDTCKCVRCGKRWKMVDKVYSILSDGDPTSYIPVWEEEKDASLIVN